jgi:hypothetical protein
MTSKSVPPSRRIRLFSLNEFMLLPRCSGAGMAGNPRRQVASKGLAMLHYKLHAAYLIRGRRGPFRRESPQVQLMTEVVWVRDIFTPKHAGCTTSRQIVSCNGSPEDNSIQPVSEEAMEKLGLR